MIKSTLTICFSLLIGAVSAQQIILKSENSAGGSIATGQSTSSDQKASDLNAHGFQPRQFKSLGNTIIETDHEVVLVGRMAPVGVNIYEVPLFGGYQKTSEQLEQDQAFILDCQKNFDSPLKASKFFSDMGWQYLSEGSKEMAIYRFNLASLLDENNVDIYWGLGVIEYQKGEYEEAIKLMTEGLKMDKQFNVTLMVDLATVQLKCFLEHQHQHDLQNAIKNLEDASLLAPGFANTYMQLALVKVINGEIDDAWLQFHKGYKIDPNSVNPQILSQLLNHKPDPKGIFE
ncbi:tetratricopeptide repeat protein [Jiulongibacter sp. NS-SX5]|uniref:tetratricopeptide repeat protein n=1 Tax=Jiulongibacter sp. NS-SX5 TaxID=3463854 RepID=UPI00405A22F5